jgi:triacylglycerol lipase
MTDSTIRGLAGQVSQADPKALAPEKLEALIGEFIRISDHGEELQWIQQNYPGIGRFFTETVKPKDLLEAAADGDVRKQLAKRLGDHLGQLRAESQWDDLGLSLHYETVAREAHNAAGWSFLRELRFEGKPTYRFVMPNDSYRKLIPGQGDVLDRWFDQDMKNDLEEHLQRLGVANPSVVKEKIPTPDKGPVKCLHIDPHDAALLMDAHLLSMHGERLELDDWLFARRLAHGDHPQGRNSGVVPVAGALKMRGINHGLPVDAPIADIIARCKQRLADRGVADPQVEVIDVGGKQTLSMPPEQAAVLMAPLAKGDPAGRIYLKRFEVDAKAKGYDPEIGVLLTQAAQLAYEGPDTLPAYAKAWGFPDAKCYENKATDAQAFTAFDPDRNLMLIAFRGTESGADAKADARSGAVPGPEFGGGGIHSGFAAQLRSILPEMMKTIREVLERGGEPPTIMIGGHSLGGAMARLLQAHLLHNKIMVHHVYTCGEPKSGDETFAANLDRLTKAAGTNAFRYVNNNDIVCRIPPQWDHASSTVELYIDSNGKLRGPKDSASWRSRSADRLNGIWSNWMRGGGTVIDSFRDHYSACYLEAVRKNRETRFEGVLETIAEIIGTNSSGQLVPTHE